MDADPLADARARRWHRLRQRVWRARFATHRPSPGSLPY